VFQTACPRDQWIRFVYRLQFARTGNGQMQAWKDGVEIFDDSIPPGYNQTNGPYFKFGIYRHPTDNTAIVE
jgi:Polysaccharide lyase